MLRPFAIRLWLLPISFMTSGLHWHHLCSRILQNSLFSVHKICYKHFIFTPRIMKQQASKLGIISFALFNPCSVRYSLYFICRICGLAMALPSRLKGDLVPVCVAVGMIVVSTSLGLYTAMHQLRWAPDVLVRKSRRETLPEVVEPEHVVDQTKKFITKSFFRKVGHVQDTDLRNRFIPDPSHRDILASKLHTETLKSVGVDPKLH